MKGNTMINKTITLLVGVVVFAFVAIAVYATTDAGQTLTNDTSIANAEVTNTEVSSQVYGKDCKTCEDCYRNCEDCDDCDKPCKGHGEGRMCGGHGEDQGHKSDMCGGHGCGI